MKTKHTPGPWVAEQHGEMQLFTISQESTKRIGAIAEKVWGKNNARLIAAAPDLLEACLAAVSRLSVLDQGSSVVAMLDKAISKSQGE